jgi:predicted RNase H-like HicB family nuclease
MALNFKIATGIEEDRRWIAEAIGLPGVLAYGRDEDEAIRKVEALALRVIADRIESENAPASRSMSVSFGAGVTGPARRQEWYFVQSLGLDGRLRMRRVRRMSKWCILNSRKPHGRFG